MALLRCDVFSEALGLSTSMTVILPQATSAQIGMVGDAGEEPPPVLYLLHGLVDDDTVWFAPHLDRALRRPARARGGHAAGASQLLHGRGVQGRFWTFVAEELPQLVSRFFRVSGRREDTFVAGLSMGDYGAFKLALRQPGRFAAAGAARHPGRDTSFGPGEHDWAHWDERIQDVLDWMLVGDA